VDYRRTWLGHERGQGKVLNQLKLVFRWPVHSCVYLVCTLRVCTLRTRVKEKGELKLRQRTSLHMGMKLQDKSEFVFGFGYCVGALFCSFFHFFPFSFIFLVFLE
jgi:hypothetical protein